MLNVAFCDDDRDFLSRIVPETEKIFGQLRTDARIHAFTGGTELISEFKKYDSYFDAVFLDIDMPEKNGKEVARELRVLDKRFKLVFITAYEREALNTFQYDVIGFLPKNLLKQRLGDMVKLLVERIEEDNPRVQLFMADESGMATEIKIPLDDIVFFESINKKVYLHAKRRSFALHRCQFSEIVRQYLPLGFVDIHRTCIVNLKYIFSIGEIEIRLDDGTRLPLSRRKRQALFDRFSQLVAEEVPK